MPARKKSTEKSRRKFFDFTFIRNINESTRSNILKVCGVFVGVIAVLTLIAVIAYLFTWKADQSLNSEVSMLDGNVEVSNSGGKIGYRWSHFLVSTCFGLGCFPLIFLVGLYAWKLFHWHKRIGFVRNTLLAVSGAYVSSILLSYLSSLVSDDTFFGGGLGGDMGAATVAMMKNLFGVVVTGLIILALVLVWSLFASRRFAIWFSTLGSSDDKQESPEGTGVEQGSQDAAASDGNEILPDGEIVGDDDGAGPSDDMGLDNGEVNGDGNINDGNVSDGNVNGAEVNDGDADGNLEVVAPDPNLQVIRDESLGQQVLEELPPIDVRADLENYKFPSLSLLKDYNEAKHKVSQFELETNNGKIIATLKNHKVEVQNVTAVVGPTVTLYKVFRAPGVRIASIENLHKEIAMALGKNGVRIVTLPDCVGIEVPNSVPSLVPLKSMLDDDSFRNTKAELPIAIGYTITQKVKTFDLTDAPHLLVAGATKMGKSVGLNVIISSLLYAKHPSELKFVFIDPKEVEFTSYNSLLKHYLAVLPSMDEESERQNAIIKNAKLAEQVLNSLCLEMDERYKLLSLAGQNDLKLYNEKYKNRRLLPTEGHKYLPYLVVVIDEYADLMMAGGAGGEARKSAKNVSDYIIRLAQKGRAAGIHVIIATQRPSVNVVTGLIKSNFPTRIAFRVVSRVDSQTILDKIGAENLIGKGDMLYYAGVETERIQCAYVSMAEINAITSFIGSQTKYHECYQTPYYLPYPSNDGESGVANIEMGSLDELFEDAARVVVTTKKGSTSDIQRKLGVGFPRAGRIMEQLEAAGIVGPQENGKPRQVLISSTLELDELLSTLS